MTNELKVYRDADRFIIGRPEWQECLSMTYGVAMTYSRKEAHKIAKEMGAMTAAAVDASKRVFWTDGRFEDACDAGRFGGDW